MNKKGFLRIIEAVIAIVLLLAFILYINYKTPSIDFKTPAIVKDSMSSILNQIALDTDLRKCALNGEGECSSFVNGQCSGVFCPPTCNYNTKFTEIMTKRIVNYDYACEVCEESLSCTTISEKLQDKTVYTDTIFIANTHDVNSEPRVVRLYFWEK